MESPRDPAPSAAPEVPRFPEAGPEGAAADAFAALGLEPALTGALAALGYEEPTPIQRAAIPVLLAGRDVLGQAATGTGKTAAFALPLLQRLVTGEPVPHRPRALVLVPTRELAMQVAEAVHRYGRERHATVLPIYGGQPMQRQLRALERGVEVVVATPGRALDHLERGTLVLDDVAMVVLDEADEMLDMGFADELEALLTRTPGERQTALFSATLPQRILSIASAHLKDPERISIARERTAPGEVPRVRQVAYVVPRVHKPRALGRVLDMEQPSAALVFCRTRLEVDELTEAMNARGYRAEALHGGFAQEQRDRVMKRFRTEKADLLIATDVAARGLDIEHVSHVVNYDVPVEPEDYVHRIGRTGRAGREGVAITLLEPREQRLLRNIQHAVGQPIQVATLPSVADLRARRFELTREAVREALEDGAGDELERFRELAGELARGRDALDVAAAAMKLLHEEAAGSGAADEEEIVIHPPVGREGERRGRGFERRPFDAARGARGPREYGDGGPPRHGPGGRGRHAGFGASVRLFIGAGHQAQVRAGDLVGAITHEAGLSGADIGGIRITDRFSLVEVRPEHAERVIQALRNTTLRGRKVMVRRDRNG